jgi:hypothetical protein
MIPSTINICGVPHEVILCPDNFDTDSHFGQIDYTQALIKINQDMPEEMQKQALCHEWLHGALVMLGFNDQSQNEQFVQALSMAINMTFDIKESKKNE